VTEVAGKTLRARIVAVTSHLLCGFGLLPVLVFVVGEAVVGPYAGTSGLASFLGTIYGDLLTFEPGAWILVATPSLIVGAWYGAMSLQRFLLKDDRGSSKHSS